ncbi:DUF4384 domain-containing protein [Deinococcus oregonensis]|uniref:DUF4384 domain-containing protein n=1 Tax=Deinococcus oregonensis TaxID=1805970 RepID=A0ABV6AWN4_9DEIO
MYKFIPLALPAVLVAALVSCTSPPLLESSTPTPSLSVSPNPISVGQELRFSLGIQDTSDTWNVALFVENPAGKIDQFLPNRLEGGTPAVMAGAPVLFPPAEAAFRLVASAPTGPHTALLYITPKTFNMEGISAYANAQAPFATVSGSGIGTLEGPLLTKIRSLNPGQATWLRFQINP